MSGTWRIYYNFKKINGFVAVALEEVILPDILESAEVRTDIPLSHVTVGICDMKGIAMLCGEGSSRHSYRAIQNYLHVLHCGLGNDFRKIDLN